MADELFPGGWITGPQIGEGPDLFLWAERAGETARFQMERKHEEFGREKLQQGQQHTEHLQNRSSIQYERGERVQNRFLLVEKGGLWQDEYMTGEQSYHYYNEFLWPDRYADCVPMDKALELLKK